MGPINRPKTRMIALTRGVSSSIARCELTHLDRSPISYDLAVAQHHQYELSLGRMGCEMIRLPAKDELPDSVFIEDTAVVLDELAIITRPGAASRRAETSEVAKALERYRPTATIEAPGTLDGGDVLRAGSTLYVGLSSRTNEAGAAQLERLAVSCGIRVQRVQVSQCLHLKTAVTELAEGTLLLNPEWTDPRAFPGMEIVAIDPAEPFGANVVRVGETALYSTSFPRTLDRLLARGGKILTVDASELARAEGALTCCSLLFQE